MLSEPVSYGLRLLFLFVMYEKVGGVGQTVQTHRGEL
jgi:hypothetical protein